VPGGKPGVMTWARQLMVVALRLAISTASSRSACSLRTGAKLLSSDRGSGTLTVSPAMRNLTPCMSTPGWRGSSRKRRLACGASAWSRSKRSTPCIILR
jgi:hypothetical protein